MAERGQFLLDYIDLLLHDGRNEADGFRHTIGDAGEHSRARGRERWVVNKIRALCAWYSKGIDGGSNLRSRVNTAQSVAEIRALVDEFFFV